MLGIIAGISGVSAWHIKANPTDWLAIVGAISFGAAALVEGWWLFVKPDRVWYDGRAVAESLRHLHGDI